MYLSLLSVTAATVVFYITSVNGIEINKQTPATCATGAQPQYFDSTRLICQNCGQSGTFQKKSADGLSCECQVGYKITENSGGKTLKCEKCPANQVTSMDGWSCVNCPPDYPINQNTGQCGKCPVTTHATVQLDINGTRLVAQECNQCDERATPSHGNQRCIACRHYEFVKKADNCDCPTSTNYIPTGGFCFPTRPNFPVDAPSLYQVSDLVYPPTVNIESYWFKENIRAAFGQCSIQYNNITACQIMANLCTLLMFRKTNIGSTNKDACDLWNTLDSQTRPAVPGNSDQKSGMPWLYYQDSKVLEQTKITTQFSRYTKLLFHSAVYSLNGKFLGFRSFSDGLLQLCKNSESEMNAAYLFGTKYTSSCNIHIDDLFDGTKYPLEFFEPFLEFQSTNGQARYAVPVRILQYINQQQTFVNNATDKTNWQLTRRFFLVDNQAAKKLATDKNPEFIKYPKKITITISLVTGTKEGKIYTPYISIDYAVAKNTELGQNKTVTVSFAVEYTADTTSFYYELSVAMGTLSALAAVYAFMRTWAWSKRAGQLSVDVVTVLKTLVFGCSAIANVFLLVVFGLSFWLLVFYKNQNVVSLFMLNAEQERNLSIYIGTAFTLKCVEIIHLILSQSTVDIFFIDWEKPRAKPDAAQTKSANEKQADMLADEDVSIWRTYFVANEWNEIQTYRKTSRVFNIMAVLFFLSVLGFENFGTSDPYSTRYFTNTMYKAPYSQSFRFAVNVCTWVVVAIVQWVIYILIYEKFVEDKLRNYVDLCSVSNVSVFVMAHKQFGYYIHGQSVHGSADVSLRQMYANLRREQENLCARRGMDLDSDQQTFMMALPTDMREKFDKHYNMFSDNPNGLDTYRELNKLLQGFITKSNPNAMQFNITNRRLLEDILDCEFDPYEPGKFFIDDGNSFGNVLFYGNELSLVTFDLLVFCVTDLYGVNNVVLNALMVWFAGWLIDSIRDGLGSRNLAKKTLVDERFLI